MQECMKGHDVERGETHGRHMASIKRARVLYAKYFTISEAYWKKGLNQPEFLNLSPTIMAGPYKGPIG